MPFPFSNQTKFGLNHGNPCSLSQQLLVPAKGHKGVNITVLHARRWMLELVVLDGWSLVHLVLIQATSLSKPAELLNFSHRFTWICHHQVTDTISKLLDEGLPKQIHHWDTTWGLEDRNHPSSSRFPFKTSDHQVVSQSTPPATAECLGLKEGPPSTAGLGPVAICTWGTCCQCFTFCQPNGNPWVVGNLHILFWVT